MTAEMTLDEIRSAGLAALARELGPVGFVRFMQMFERGYGDYTQERSTWLEGQSIDDIVTRIREQRAGREGPSDIQDSS